MADELSLKPMTELVGFARRVSFTSPMRVSGTGLPSTISSAPKNQWRLHAYIKSAAKFWTLGTNQRWSAGMMLAAVTSRTLRKSASESFYTDKITAELIPLPQLHDTSGRFCVQMCGVDEEVLSQNSMSMSTFSTRSFLS